MHESTLRMQDRRVARRGDGCPLGTAHGHTVAQKAASGDGGGSVQVGMLPQVVPLPRCACCPTDDLGPRKRSVGLGLGCALALRSGSHPPAAELRLMAAEARTPVMQGYVTLSCKGM